MIMGVSMVVGDEGMCQCIMVGVCVITGGEAGKFGGRGGEGG